jgi:hypothetical protein
VNGQMDCSADQRTMKNKRGGVVDRGGFDASGEVFEIGRDGEECL